MPPRRSLSRSRIADMHSLSNVIGDRGEKVFELAITDYKNFRRPLFKPGFLGEKWPALDYYVELTGVRGSTPFFFVQVKSTTTGINAHNNTISIQASKAKCDSLFKIPGPTYIVGVHEPERRAFILSMHAKVDKGIYSIPIKYELNSENLQRLHEEVIDFWKKAPHKPTGSYFT